MRTGMGSWPFKAHEALAPWACEKLLGKEAGWGYCLGVGVGCLIAAIFLKDGKW